MSTRIFRGLLGGGALLLGVVFAVRRSGDPTVFGRYSLEYFLLLLAYAPFMVAAIVSAIVTDDVRRSVRSVSRNWSSWSVAVLILVPAVLVGARFARAGAPLDLVRMLGLLSLTGAYAVVAIALASRQRPRAFKLFSGCSFAAVSSVYLATLLVTPLLGDWVEREMGIPAETTFDVVQPGEYDRSMARRPNASFVYTGSPGQVREFAVTVENNSWGFRDRERTLANPDGRPRIIVLGGGYVQAWEVPRDSAFPAVLEQRLSEDGEPMEVIPLARRGAGQTTELELLEEYGEAIGPDLVIVVWATSDVLSNDPELGALAVELPDAVLFPGLLIDRLATKWLQKRAYLLGDAYRLSVLRPDYWAYLEPTPPPLESALAKTEARLDQIVNTSRALGSDVMVVIKRPTNELRWLKRFPSLRDYEFNTDAHAEWLDGYARSRGISFVDLGPALQDHYDQFPTGHEMQYSWPHSGQLREPGHRLAAEMIYEAIVGNGLLERWRSPVMYE